eukprot:jgi/Botrbrau1/20520/Bobra.145_2s0073.1
MGPVTWGPHGSGCPKTSWSSSPGNHSLGSHMGPRAVRPHGAHHMEPVHQAAGGHTFPVPWGAHGSSPMGGTWVQLQYMGTSPHESHMGPRAQDLAGPAHRGA